MGGNNGPLTMALLRIWLFGLYLSSMESFFLDRADPLWFTFLLAVFGLHYLARFRVERLTGSCARTALATSCHQPSKSNACLHRRPFQRGDDPVGIGLRPPIRARTSTMAPRSINSLKRAMMVEFFRSAGPVTISGRPACTQVENAGAPRGEAFIERIAERVDLAEQAEYLVIGGDKAG